MGTVSHIQGDATLRPPRTFRIALIAARFNERVTDLLLDGALARLRELGVPEADVTVARVPGAVEIPIVAQRLAQSGNVDAVVGLGAVVRGETPHFDYVCQQVAYGCQRVSLDSDVPVIFGVLTTDDETQALDRCGGKHGHKGREAVDTAVQIVNTLRELD